MIRPPNVPDLGPLQPPRNAPKARRPAAPAPAPPNESPDTPGEAPRAGASPRSTADGANAAGATGATGSTSPTGSAGATAPPLLEIGPDDEGRRRFRVSEHDTFYTVCIDPTWRRDARCNCGEASRLTRAGGGLCRHAVTVLRQVREVRFQLLDVFI